MKTQISHLRSGTKNQILNTTVDYSTLPRATSHLGHSGSNRNDVKITWEQILQENPKRITIEIFGEKYKLYRCESISKKTIVYRTILLEKRLNLFGLTPSKNHNPFLSIHDANTVIADNGKKSYIHICPSLITIL